MTRTFAEEFTRVYTIYNQQRVNKEQKREPIVHPTKVRFERPKPFERDIGQEFAVNVKLKK